ncbi:MAG: hypothetical protein ACI4RC_03150 [Oscillospiraceae bacterium]
MKEKKFRLGKIVIDSSVKPEKVIVTAALSLIGAVFTINKKKKINHPEKYKPFILRAANNYALLDSFQQKSSARQYYKHLKEENDTVSDKKLNNLTIEKGEFLD